MKLLQFLAVAALLAPLPSQAAPLTAAIFPFELDDTSLPGAINGPRTDEGDRLSRLSAQLAELLARSGRYAPVDIAPEAAEARAAEFRTCNGCEAAMARKLGAQVAVIGWVQKVSNLILNINVVIRDAGSGKVLRAGSADIRGNTDDSWSRGLSWLAAHRLLNESGDGAR